MDSRSGHIVTAVGEKRYLVRFDDGQEKECSSNSLKVERMHEALPPDVVPPPPSKFPEQRESNLLAEEVEDQEEDEHLALAAPEGEEREGGEEESKEDENAEPTFGMPGQHPTEKDQPNIKDYHEIKRAAKERIDSKAGQQVTVTSSSNGPITWTVTKSLDPDDVIPEFEPKVKYGLKDFDLQKCKKSEVFSSIFLLLLFKDWRTKVKKMNEAVVDSKTKC